MATASEYTLEIGEAAARLGVGKDTLRRWCIDGRLPYLTTPGGWRRFRPEDVETFAASLESKGAV